MVKQVMGAALKKVEIDQGLGDATPGTGAAFVCICNLHFDSMATFQPVLAASAQKVMGDIPNFTNVMPTIQVSEVKM